MKVNSLIFGTLLLITLFSLPLKTNAQDTTSRVSIGFGGGLNNYSGIFGVCGEKRIYKPIFLRVGLGIGDWGTKFTVGVRYEDLLTHGWSLGLGYSVCSGLGSIKSNLPTDSAEMIVTKEVAMNLNKASTLNISALYSWNFRRHPHAKFYLEFGYSIALQPSAYSITDGSVLTDAGTRAMKLVSPGGAILDLGFLFGL